MSLAWSDIAPLRLVSQQLTDPQCKTAAELVGWLGAVQAQEYAATKWGLGVRLPHLVDDDIEKELIQGHLLRTHLLRPTWHFVNAKDIRWMLALTAPRVHAANAYMYRQLELDTTLFLRCNNLIVKSLEGGKTRTREALNQVFKENKIRAEGHRLSYLMMQAELDGILCSGPRQDKQFTYALLEERVPKVAPIETDEALAELTRRYFLSRGPATVKDFSTWSGLTVTECKKGIEMVKSHLSNEKVNGHSHYFSSSSPTEQKAQATHIHLLPIYDELVMGYKDRTPLFDYKNSLKNASFYFDSMMVDDGQVIGTWKRTIHTKYIELEYALFQPFTKRQSTFFQKAILRMEEFYGMAVHLKSVD